MSIFRTSHPDVRPATTVLPAAPHTPARLSGELIGGNGGYVLPPEFPKVREAVQNFLVNDATTAQATAGMADVRRLIEPVYLKALTEANMVVTRVERDKMLELILADILGFGPIQPLLDRDDITEVMVNGFKQVYVEKEGKLYLTDVCFIDNAHVMAVIQRIVAPLGRRIDESSPMVDGRLPDGSRVNAIIPPISLIGPCITIRKFRRDPLKTKDLIGSGTITPELGRFLEAAVIARLNIIVSGGTGSGKTTLLNVLSAFIPSSDRIVTIEDAAELQLQQPHVIRLEKRLANIEGKGEVGIRDLVVNSLRMRPDRIIVGEVRSGEALDMLQAMNTGHDGSMTTVHANSPRDSLSRIETMVLMAGIDLPMRAVRQQMAAAVDLIVQLERMRDGVRRVVKCSENVGMEGETVVMQDIFDFRHAGLDENGRISGELRPTGLRPRVNDKLEAAGIFLPPSVFALEQLGGRARGG